MVVGVIGLGLIGGSMVIDLKRRGYASTVLGVEKESVNAAAAEKIGLVDEVVSLDECILRSDIVVLAVPVGAATRMLPEILDRFGDLEGTDKASVATHPMAESLVQGAAQTPEGAARTLGRESGRGKIVIDVCSTKENLTRAVHYHPLRSRYVATHPMAGTEYSGPWAAQPGLFDGRACIICNAEESAPEAVREVERLYGALNMRLTYMNAANHDVHTAYVSHISHITSFALALTVLDKEKDEKHIFDLASGGFSSTVRLAKSSADMWVPILSQNRDNVLRVIDTYIEKMGEFRDAISSDDSEKIRSLIEEANHIKRILR